MRSRSTQTGSSAGTSTWTGCPIRLELGPHRNGRLVDQGRQIDRDPVQGHSAGLDSRQVKRIVYEGDQPVAVGAHDLQEFLLCVVDRARFSVQDQVNVAFD